MTYLPRCLSFEISRRLACKLDGLRGCAPPAFGLVAPVAAIAMVPPGAHLVAMMLISVHAVTIAIRVPVIGLIACAAVIVPILIAALISRLASAAVLIVHAVMIIHPGLTVEATLGRGLNA